MKFTQTIVVFLIAIQVNAAENTIPDIIPDISGNTELSIVQEPAYYEGDDLFTMIDGGAEIYFEYGFETAASVSYLLRDTRIELQLYQMRDIGAAYGVFTHSAQLRDSVFMEQEAQLFIQQTYSMFQKGKYFGILSWSGSGDSLRTVIRSLHADIFAAIDTITPLPELVLRTLNAGYLPGEFKYLRGTISLSAIHFFSHKNIFNITEAVYLPAEDSKQIVFTYPEEKSSAGQLEKLKAEFRESSRITEYSEDTFELVYVDRKGRKIFITQNDSYLIASIYPAGYQGSSASLPEGFR